MKLLHDAKWLMALTPLLFVACGSSSSSADTTLDNGKVGDGRLSEIVTHYQEKHNIPAMAVLTVDHQQTVEQAAVGVRQIEKKSKVQVNEHWNIGSITKSMTATLVAVLIDQGMLTWETTLAEVFPEQREHMLEQYKSVTMVELLSHTSGLPQDSDEIWEEFIGSDDTLIEQRYDLTQEALIYPSETSRGEFLYSNINYVVASAMLERVSSSSFESLIQTYLFDALAMMDSYLDSQGDENRIRGHKEVAGEWQSVDPSEENAENAKIVAPAGSQTFVTLEDMSRYLRVHLQAKMGEDTALMSQENFSKLHTKVVDADQDLGYALGWFTESNYGLQHTGSNGRWFTLSFINAETGYGYFVVINAYKAGVEQAVFEMMNLLIDRTKKE